MYSIKSKSYLVLSILVLSATRSPVLTSPPPAQKSIRIVFRDLHNNRTTPIPLPKNITLQQAADQADLEDLGKDTQDGSFNPYLILVTTGKSPSLTTLLKDCNLSKERNETHYLIRVVGKKSNKNNKYYVKKSARKQSRPNASQPVATSSSAWGKLGLVGVVIIAIPIFIYSFTGRTTRKQKKHTNQNKRMKN